MYQSNRRVTFAEKQRFIMAKKKKNSIIEICPVRNVVARFGNKWALLVIIILDENGPIRFNQLRKQIPDISTKVLSNTLRVLEADGLVKRTVFPEVPVRVEYELTETGRTLVPIVLSLTEWAKNNMKSIMMHRKKFEDSTKQP
jgi:DNA-binding HxlR family transcriptional regulator